MKKRTSSAFFISPQNQRTDRHGDFSPCFALRRLRPKPANRTRAFIP
ncbi:MAG: hypothetical protein L6Q57_02645 [Alphaproteobacteria bacterium]|nr:hypothetical protein [Alphaproteobacteria bacterium]